MLPNMQLKRLKDLPKKLKLPPLPKNNTLRKISREKNLLLNLPNKLLLRLKRRSLLLRLPQLSGRQGKKSKRENQKLQLPQLRLQLLKEKQNLKNKENVIRLSMMQLLRLKQRHSELHLWLPKLLIKLPRRQEELARKNKSRSTRERWLLEDPLSRKHSETSGPPDPLVFPCFT